MKQRFESLGVILSRDAQKKLVGGDDPLDVIGDSSSCGTCTWGDQFPNSRSCTSGKWGGCDCPGGAYACNK